jgi:hypothetical protein
MSTAVVGVGPFVVLEDRGIADGVGRSGREGFESYIISPLGIGGLRRRHEH